MSQNATMRTIVRPSSVVVNLNPFESKKADGRTDPPDFCFVDMFNYTCHCENFVSTTPETTQPLPAPGRGRKPVVGNLFCLGRMNAVYLSLPDLAGRAYGWRMGFLYGSAKGFPLSPSDRW